MAWKKLYIQPNKAAQKAAKRGLEARKKAPKSKKGGLDAVQASMAGVGSGVLRARDIVAGKRVNAYQVNAFFNRLNRRTKARRVTSYPGVAAVGW
jgi:hypothetical protein